MLRSLLASLLLSLVVFASGCSWLRGEDRRPVYLDSASGKALEIPPDMDSPARRDNMDIPAGEGTRDGISAVPPGGIDVVAGSIDGGVKIDLAPADAFDEIKSALVAAEVGKIESANAATLAIRVNVIVKKEKKRWFRKDKVEEMSVQRTLSVAANGAGSVVTVADESGTMIEDDAATKLLGIVRDRFGG